MSGNTGVKSSTHPLPDRIGVGWCAFYYGFSAERWGIFRSVWVFLIGIRRNFAWDFFLFLFISASSVRRANDRTRRSAFAQMARWIKFRAEEWEGVWPHYKK